MSNYVHIELELLERVCDRHDLTTVASLKAYAAIAYCYLQGRLAKPRYPDPKKLAGLSDEVWAHRIKWLEHDGLILSRNGKYEPRSCNGDDYLWLDSRGHGHPFRDKEFIQVSADLFKRWKPEVAITPRTTKTRRTNPPIFTDMTPEEFYLYCLLIQGVRLFLFCGLDPSYVNLRDPQHPKLAEHISRRFFIGRISENPNEILESLLAKEGLFKIVLVPMKKVDTYNETLTFVPPWDSRHHDNQTGHDTKANDLVSVLLPIRGYKVSSDRDKAFLAAIHLLPNDYHGFKETLEKYYGSASKEFWSRYWDKRLPRMTTDELLKAVKPYE